MASRVPCNRPRFTRKGAREVIHRQRRRSHARSKPRKWALWHHAFMAKRRAVVRILHPNLGGVGTNTWHIRTSGLEVDTTTMLGNAMEAVETFYTACAGLFPDTCTFSWDGSLSGILDEEGQFNELDPWTTTGAVAGGSLPPANCICVSWLGATGDRSRRGRTFLGPIATNVAESNGTISTAALGAARAAAAALVDASTDPNDWALCVFSRQESLLRDFVGSAVRDQFAVLRSRRD